MLYTIIESFSPLDGERWTRYCAWRGVPFARFDSIDALLRPPLFTAPEALDWEHVVNESMMLHLITGRSYAQQKHREIGQGELIGIRLEEHDPQDEAFLGFDIIDRYWEISLLTNWGNDIEIVNRSLAPNALVPEWAIAKEILQHLQANWGDDPHVEGCHIVSLYQA